MTSIAEFAPAKLNLSLQIAGKRSDGYHLLNSVVAFCDLGDRLMLTGSDHFSLNITGPFGRDLDASQQNLVWRASHLLADAVGHTSVRTHLTLEKNLPIASGLGGGSADAAAALRLLLKHWNVPVEDAELQNIALTLGADVPMCLESVSAAVAGIGEQISPIKIPALELVVVNPGIGLSTAQVFENASYSCQSNSPADYSFNDSKELVVYLSGLTNDLESSAIELAPEISDCLQALKQQSKVMLARMSGSGATCFGIFPSQTAAKLAQENIQRRNSNWWVRYTRTLV